MATTELDRVTQENRQKPYPKNPSKISIVSDEFETRTIYLGSKVKNTTAILRIYDKKAEQLEN